MIEQENTARYIFPDDQASAAGPSPAAQCETFDDKRNKREPHLGPSFACFRAALYEAIENNRLHLLRIAIADFLFEFKYANQYPMEFDSGDNGRSAQNLDTQLAPILTAFNRDVARYLEFVQHPFEGNQKGITFASNGLVTVRTISAVPAELSAVTQNKFSETPTLPIGELLTAFDEKAGLGIPPITVGNAITAAIRASAPAVATLGRSLALKVTSNSLPGASAAELKLSLETKDEPGSAKILRGADSKDDPNTRVASHSVTTSVRVDSLKLFQVSSFAAELRRGRKPFPLLPPYVELPGIGSLVSLPMAPSKAFHRSFAIVSAVVLPTAADLASGISFSPDTIATPRQLAVSVKPEGAGTKYVIVARLQGGGIIIERAEGPTPSFKAPVRIRWSGLGNEARYDLYEEAGSSSYVMIRENLAVPDFVDKGIRVAAMVPHLPAPTPALLELRTISPATFLTGSVPAYHMRTLQQIEREAKGLPASMPVLTAQPVFRY